MLMKRRNRIPAWLLLGLLVAAVIAVVGCGGGGAPTSPASTPVPTPTPTTPAPAVFEIDESTRWGDLVGQFSGAERECIRAELGAERYGVILDEPAAIKSAMWAPWPEPWAEVWEVFLWGCLTQETAIGLLWANLSASMDEVSEMFYSTPPAFGEEEEGRKLDLSEDCLRDMVAYIDFSRFVSVGLPWPSSGEARILNDYSGAFHLFFIGMLFCDKTVLVDDAADEFFESEEFWFNPGFLWSHAVEELGDAEVDCIRTEFGEVYDTVLARPLVGEATDFREVAAWGCITQENAARLFADNVVQLFAANAARLESSETLETLTHWPTECQQQALAGVDYPLLISAGLPEQELPSVIENLAVAIGLAYCTPAALEGYENYHLDPVGKTPISIGETASAALDYPNDWDEFSFHADAGVDYRIYFTHEKGLRFYVYLYDSNSELLLDSDNYRNSQTFGINWTAPDTGEYRISIGPIRFEDPVGPYTLTITARPEP